jgi:poly(3-hydroxybutyrate) depolymerase
MNPRFLAKLAVVVLTVLGSTEPDAQVTSLPALKVNVHETSVSGLSSGAYMAVQFHVAFSSTIKGAGIIAGGPYFCARDSQDTATRACACVGPPCQPAQAAQEVPGLIQTTDQNASRGAIDPTSHLASSRVWLFSGSADTVVPTPIMNALETYYKNYIGASNIAFERGIAAEHAVPTDSFGNACNFKGEPFVNNCSFDAAGALLKWIYGSLNPRNTAALSGKLIKFDQSEFISNPASHGMWPTGWAYVPASCEHNAGCKLHVVFHGCKQYPDWPYSAGPQGKIGDTIVKEAGYNQWADTNDIVVLYPQANAMNVGTRFPRSNPVGCWDWWGYDDAAYSVKGGRQMAAVKAMVDRLGGSTVPEPPPAGFCGTASNAGHVAAGRAHSFFWWYFAQGSNEFLGFSGSTQTTLKETAPGSYERAASCP